MRTITEMKHPKPLNSFEPITKPRTQKSWNPQIFTNRNSQRTKIHQLPNSNSEARTENSNYQLNQPQNATAIRKTQHRKTPTKLSHNQHKSTQSPEIKPKTNRSSPNEPVNGQNQHRWSKVKDINLNLPKQISHIQA